jgi:succinoglycan biosynthesis protein ExoO
MRDWELLVYDSYSDDGAWEFIQQRAAWDNRIRVTQGPREGPYPAWNRCLCETKAEFVYIATSDDTMAADCLEKMVVALERYRDCDLAHCPSSPSTVQHARGRAKWPDLLQVLASSS